MSRSKRVTLRDVAQRAGVSTPQASLALNGQGRVAASTAQRVRSAADELGYRPNPAARALRAGHGDSVGLITRNLSNPYFLDVLKGMESVTSDRGSSVVVMDSGYDAANELEAVRRMADSRVSALALAPVGGTESVEWWRTHRPELPLVLLNVPPRAGIATIGPDNVTAAALAVDHLADLGHKRLGFVRAPEPDAADADRAGSFLRRCRERGVAGEFVHARLRFESVRSAVAAELDDTAGLRAFLMNSDYTASAVYQAARDTGLTVGRDVSVVGHDDLPTSGLLAPPMTTIAFDRREVGRLTANTLLDPPRSPGDMAVPVRLVERQSVVDRLR